MSEQLIDITQLPGLQINQDRRLLLEAEQDREGMRIEQCRAFIEGYNLPVNPFSIISAESALQIASRVSDATLKQYLLAGGKGYSIQPLNVALVLRQRSDELLNGTVVAESILVEELVHSASYLNNLVLFNSSTRSYRLPARGFMERIEETNEFEGVGLEEGYAAMIAGKYTETTPDVNRQASIDELYPGADNLDTVPFIHLHNGKVRLNYPIPMPIKYANFVRFGDKLKANFRVNSFAAYAVELLCQFNPGLEHTMHAARRSAEGMTSLKEHLAAIHPILTGIMNSTGYDYNHFVAALDFVIKNVTKGKPALLQRYPASMDQLWDKANSVASLARQ